MKLINSDIFEDTISGSSIVQFSATWCGPCKVLTSVIEKNENNLNSTFYKIDIDASQDIAAKYNIRSVPTLIRFESGKEVDRLIGNASLSKLTKFAS